MVSGNSCHFGQVLLVCADLLLLPCVAGDDYGPAPDLDHLNPDLRTALKDWMNYLKDDVGYGGWRFDFVKGYGARFIQVGASHCLCTRFTQCPAEGTV